MFFYEKKNLKNGDNNHCFKLSMSNKTVARSQLNNVFNGK